jgi:hypothetical protein
MSQCEVALIDYFKDNLEHIKNANIGYRWKIKNIKDFTYNGHDDYYANVELKKHFYDKWHSSEQADKYGIAEQIVKDWGNVRGHAPETLPNYIRELKKERPNTPLKGVASYSKIFSVTDLDKYAIYDSRVAACLNAIQYNYNRAKKTKGGIAFHYVPGRNNIIGAFKLKTRERIGFVHQPQFKRNALIESGWQDIGRDETYATYLKTLKNCLENFRGYKLYDLEMSLFSNAEKECLKATKP